MALKTSVLLVLVLCCSGYRSDAQTFPATQAAAATTASAPAVAPSTHPAAAAAVKACSVADIQKAVEAGQNYLLKSQNVDGSWSAPIIPGNPIASHPAGTTSLAVRALFASGVLIDDPQIKKSLEWLVAQKIDKTCPLALRAIVCRMAVERNAICELYGDYRPQLESDVKQLIDSTADGSYWADATGDHGKSSKGLFDAANSAYALQGIGASRDRVEIPNEFWQGALNHWLKYQQADGGWEIAKAGPSLAVTTANGVAAMYGCVDNLLFDQ